MCCRGCVLAGDGIYIVAIVSVATVVAVLVAWVYFFLWNRADAAYFSVVVDTPAAWLLRMPRSIGRHGNASVGCGYGGVMATCCSNTAA